MNATRWAGGLGLAAAGWLAACGGSADPQPRYLERLAERARPVTCGPAAGLEPGRQVADLSATPDSGVLIVYGYDREVALHGPSLEPLRRIRFEAEGPRGIRGLRSAAVRGDTLLALDEEGRTLSRFDLEGRPIARTPLPFPPRLVRSTADDVLIVPVHYAGVPPRLLYRNDGDSVAALDVRPVERPDPVWSALANTVTLLPVGGSDWLLAHLFFEPRAVLSIGGNPRAVGLPVAAAFQGALERRPRLPIREENVAQVPVVSLAATYDHAAGEVLLLARSGRRRIDGAEPFHERVVLRLARDLTFRRAYTLDARAVELAYLPSRRAALVVTDIGEWRLCPLP